MAETTNELLLVESVRSLLHATDGSHLLVDLEERVLRHRHAQVRGLGPVALERVFMELDREGLRVRRLLMQGGRVRCSLEAASKGLYTSRVSLRTQPTRDGASRFWAHGRCQSVTVRGRPWWKE